MPGRMLDTLSVEELVRLNGLEVRNAEGEALGYVDLVFADETTGRPEWLGIWNGLPGGRRTIVPIVGARHDGSEIRVPWPKDMVEAAPHYHDRFGRDPRDVHITREEEEAAYELYGVEPLSPRPSGVYVFRFRALVVG